MSKVAWRWEKHLDRLESMEMSIDRLISLIREDGGYGGSIDGGAIPVDAMEHARALRRLVEDQRRSALTDLELAKIRDAEGDE